MYHLSGTLSLALHICSRAFPPSFRLFDAQVALVFRPRCCWCRRLNACCTSDLPAVLVSTRWCFHFCLVDVRLADMPKFFFVRVQSKPVSQPRPTITGRQPPEAAKLNNLIWRRKKRFSSFTWLRLRCFLAYLIERHAPTLIVCWILKKKEAWF